MDEVYEKHDLHDVLPKRPSEYYWRQCYVAPWASFGPQEMALRDRIGVDKILWGTDYPHLEGMWPHTERRMKAVFAGVPEDDIRLILGENAIRVYGFDREKLEEVAQRVGPPVGSFSDEAPGAAGDYAKMWTPAGLGTAS